MIRDYLNDRVAIRRPAESAEGDFWADDNETTDTEVWARWESRRRLVRNAEGSEVVSEATVFCVDEVKDGDTLVDADGKPWPVVSVSAQKDLAGALSHYEVAL